MHDLKEDKVGRKARALVRVKNVLESPAVQIEIPTCT